jgi:hypothetical protein
LLAADIDERFARVATMVVLVYVLDLVNHPESPTP